MDGLVELSSEENKTRAILVKEKFISDFEKSYEYRKDTPVKSVSFFLFYKHDHYFSFLSICKLL